MPILHEPEERWKPVVGNPNYRVSDAGRVHSLLTSKYLRANASGRYLAVALRFEGTTTTRYIHHLVAEAFHGPRPDGLDICHGNGNRADNRAANLRYDTRSANMQDAVAHGANHNAVKTHCVHGHELTGKNLIARAGGRRGCRTCTYASIAAYNERKRAA